VKDLLENYPAPERLVQEICQKVQPYSWQRPGVRIQVDGDTLEVTQSKDVIIAVRDYVERLREEQQARKKAVKQ
jgi:hypothetical protein